MIYSIIHLDEAEYIQAAENYYEAKSDWLKMYDRERHLDLCECVATRRKQLMFTGQSACAAHDIARLDPYVMQPYCISETRKCSDFICWNYGQRDPEATVVAGLLVAGPIRTICDLAKFDSPESLLVSINHCLFKRLFTKQQLLAAIDAHSGMKGTKLLKQVLRFATSKCESPLETRAWIELYKAGITMPEQQVQIYENHKFIARVDMYWKLGKRKIILELDGRVKYTDGDILFEEKNREDALRRLGYEFIRANSKAVANKKLLQLLAEKNIPMRRYSARMFPYKTIL